MEGAADEDKGVSGIENSLESVDLVMLATG